MTLVNLMLLRAAMVTLGRYAPNLVRRLLQKMLIVGKEPAPFSFRRTLKWHEGAWHVTDVITASSWSDVVSAGIGGSQTSVYNAMSRTFQAGQMSEWLDLTGDIRNLAQGEVLRIERKL
jgi:hypothetical protein